MKHIIIVNILGAIGKSKKCLINITKDEFDHLSISNSSETLELMIREKLDQNRYNDYQIITSMIDVLNVDFII